MRGCVCALYVRLNSAIEQELRDRRVEDRANATTLLSRGSVLNPSIKKVRTKFIKKIHITNAGDRRFAMNGAYSLTAGTAVDSYSRHLIHGMP